MEINAMTGNNPHLSYDSFLRKISMLPAVQQMVIEKSQQDEVTCHNDRLSCLSALEAQRQKEALAQQAVDDAVEALRKEEAKLEKFRNACGVANSTLWSISATRQALDCELSQIHGERHLQRALHILHLLIEDCKKAISNATGGLDNKIYEDGKFAGFRKVNPELKKFIQKKTAELGKLEGIYTAATALIESEISPSSLEQKCTEFLASASYRTQVVDLAEGHDSEGQVV
jgi:hypothetical protein